MHIVTYRSQSQPQSAGFNAIDDARTHERQFEPLSLETLACVISTAQETEKLSTLAEEKAQTVKASIEEI